LDNPKKKNMSVISVAQKIFRAIIPLTEPGLKLSQDNCPAGRLVTIVAGELHTGS
jgi:hypothetical protein